jgi:hypothetical protein
MRGRRVVKKLKLEDLQVETFEAGGERDGPGTVRGNEYTAWCTDPCTEAPLNTCYETCGPTDPHQRECECYGDTQYATCGPC